RSSPSRLFPYTPLFRSFSAFCLNDNVIDVSIAPGTVAGAPARVDFRPNLPIFEVGVTARTVTADGRLRLSVEQGSSPTSFVVSRSEEHTSELQSREKLV